MSKYLLSVLLTLSFYSFGSEKSLHDLIDHGKISAVRGAVKTSDVNSVNQFGETPLILAVSKGFYEISELLIRSKADVNKADSSGNTPLFYAVSNNDIKMTKLLLQNKAQISTFHGERKETLFFEAARVGSVEIINELFKENPSLLKQKNSLGQTALFAAIESVQGKAAQRLIRLGLSLKDKDSQGVSAEELAKKNNLILRN